MSTVSNLFDCHRLLASGYGQGPGGQVGIQRQLCHPHTHLQLHTATGPGQPVLHPGRGHPPSGPASAGPALPAVFTSVLEP